MQRSTSNNSFGMTFQYTYMSHYLWPSFLFLINFWQGCRWCVRRWQSLWYGWLFGSILLRSLPIITVLTGIDLARLADLPSDVLVESRRVAERLADLERNHEESSESRKIANRRKALLRVIPSSVTSSCVYAYLIYLGYCTTFLWTLLVDPDISNIFFWNLTLVYSCERN
jgi:hypothetical protein